MVTARNRARWALPVLGLLSACLLMLSTAGCNIFGSVGAVAGQIIPQKVAAQYKGLAGKRVAVMVWAEPGIRADFPYLQNDLAAGFQDKLKTLQKTDDPSELSKATFPFAVQVLAKYQQDHPEIEAAPITDTAAKFNVDRLIYIEIEDFSTRSEASLDLYKGAISANVKVVEVTDGKGKIAYSEDDIKVTYPHDSPKEGMPLGSDAKIYEGTVDAFTTELTNRFYTHEVDDNPPDSGQVVIVHAPSVTG